MIQTVAILGATGSIGTQTISIISQFPDQFNIVLLSANQSIGKLLSLSSSFPSARLAVHDQFTACNNSASLPILKGNLEISSYLCQNPPDILVFAVDSVDCFCILKETYPFIKKIVISSKEILILAGISKLLPDIKKKTKLLPMDSEHVAIHQMIHKLKKTQIQKLVLTASGGPFYHSDINVDVSQITPEIALKHPTWKMGKKVTIDSATLVNKGIELMEARYLFDLPPSKLDTIIHPQSIVHSFCELIDGSVLSQMAYPNMELPIAYSLFYPDKKNIPSIKILDFNNFPNLSFRKISSSSMPAINLAMECMRQGGVKELLYLIADDIAVKLFLNNQLRFDQIVPFVEERVNKKMEDIELEPSTIVPYYYRLKEEIKRQLSC